jgi:hypothetical protein
MDPAGLSAEERKLKLRYPSHCRLCKIELPAGTHAFWDRTSKSARCLGCLILGQPTARPSAAHDAPLDFGMAGGSAQRLYEAKERRRRAHLRSKWWAIALMGVIGAVVGGWLGYKTENNVVLFTVVGAFLPVIKFIARPQHIASWRIGAVGEQQVGRMLDSLRDQGVVAVHDRRVPGRRTNIDHIAVASAGVFVIDTKNVAGKVTAGRSGLRVAGRRQDTMLEGVQSQLAVVRQTLSDQGVDPTLVRGVLCFTRADLPWFRPSPGGVLLHYPRGLRKELQHPGPFGPAEVHALARTLATRLPAA